MCLDLTENSKLMTAKKDIVVFKHVYYYGNGIATPYRNMRIKLLEVIESELMDMRVADTYWVSKGLHSFKLKKDALYDMIDEGYGGQKRSVVKCIIPKGSNYFIGTFMELKCYASNRIIYKEILETKTF